MGGITHDDNYLRQKWLNSGIYWFYLPKQAMSIGTSPKCGCQTLKQMLVDNDIPYYTGWPQAERRVWIVRDPVERIKSLWKNKCRDGGQIARLTSDPFYSKDWSMDQLLDAIEAGRWNHHWCPQSHYENGLATELVPLENFFEWATSHGFRLPEIINRTEGSVELSDEQLARVTAIYADDIELYERGVREYR